MIYPSLRPERPLGGARRQNVPPLLAASALAALLLWLPGPVYAPDSNPEAFGLHLLYGLAHPQVYWSMPLSSLCSDFARFLLPAYGGALFFQLLSLMALAGGFALAWALASARAAMLGLLAAGVLRHFLWSGVSADAQTALYSVTLACVALAVVFRERKFTLANSLLLGLCVGVSFLLRSPLALFPPAVLFFDFLRGRYRRPRTALAHFAALFFFPVLFLLPWIYMNASVYGKFVPFEGERGYRNVVAGAAGLSMTAEGDTYAMAGIPETSDPALHLARRMVTAPGTVFPAVARRAWLAYSWNPVLWTLALVSMLLLWRRPGTAGLALLCLYYAGLYCVSMPLEPRYILPLAPVLFGLACMLFGDTDAAPSPGPALVLSALLAPLLLGSAFAEYLAAAYPSRIGRTARELSAKHPSSGFLALMAAKDYAAQGDYLNALPFAARAVRLEPRQLRWRQQYLGLLAGSGVDVSRAAAYGPQSRGRRTTSAFLLLDCASLLERGEYLKAEIKLAQARAYWDGGFVMLRGRLDANVRALERRLWEGDSGFYMSELAGLLRLRPPQARAKLAARLARITELPQGFAQYCGAAEDNGRD